MEAAGVNCAALAETAVFLRYFSDIPDRRQPGKVIYPLDEILLLGLLAVLAGAETFTDIARFGEKKLALLRRFRPFANGTPAHDHLGDIFATLDAEHGRIEIRKYTAIHDVAWLQERHGWPGLAGVVMVESTRKLPAKTETETRFYITSLSLPAETVGPMIRDHWAIENSLHWVMDMVFRDDECRVRTQNAPENFVTLKHIASNLIRRAPGKDSQRLKRMTALWDDEFLVNLLAA